MQAIDPIDAREAEIVRIAESKEETAALQQHLTEIIEGTVFKGSHRSCQFLKYIVDQAIAGHFDSLKERVIGVELFDRSTSYDTSDDAIVRVTASDVRKRLLQHYGKNGSTSEYRISLPSGSYIPEITRIPRSEVAPRNVTAIHPGKRQPNNTFPWSWNRNPRLIGWTRNLKFPVFPCSTKLRNTQSITIVDGC